MLEQAERAFNGALTRLVTSSLHVTNGLQHAVTPAETSKQVGRTLAPADKYVYSTHADTIPTARLHLYT